MPTASNEADVPVVVARFRSLSTLTLLLLTGCVSLVGLILIIIASAYAHGNLHEALAGVGAAIFATGPVTIMVFVVTDKIYRTELDAHHEKIHDLVETRADNIDHAIASQAGQLQEAVAAESRQLQAFVSQLESTSVENQRLGVLRVFSTRADGLDAFAPYIEQEFEQTERGERRGRLWVIGTDLTGMTNHTTESFNPREIFTRAHKLDVDVHILLSDPEYSAARASGEDGEDGGEDGDTLRADARKRFKDLTGIEFKIPAHSIKYYPFRPTVFGMATSSHMLLNPYPLLGGSDRCMSIIVEDTSAQGAPEGTSIYRRFVDLHFSKTWEAVQDRDPGAPPRFVPAIRLHAPGRAEGGDLKKLLAFDGIPGGNGARAGARDPLTADLIEFSGVSVSDLLSWLCDHGYHVRLLLKYPHAGDLPEHQARKIVQAAATFRSRPQVEVRFYKAPASIRGRRLGSHLINVCWYTPVYRHSEISEVVGNLNPTITSSIRREEGRFLDRMFSEVFSGLWDHAELDP